ncbi:hypothetical protein ACFUGD_02905 [Streptomyces sp. NPDC057217]|uniref:hypothetical protein n=1 Tax=Streptomyces sp. NPDC057217 TaxID=3346054 RepID=UPI00363DF9A8
MTDDGGRGERSYGLARTVAERFGHGPFRIEHTGGAERLVWTDGPTVAQVEAAVREAGPERAGGPPRRLRLLSEGTVALGAVRLVVEAGRASGGRARPRITPGDVERLWRDVPFPSPATDRERDLAHAVVHRAHDDRRSNHVGAGPICDLVTTVGLAWFLERVRAPLAPAELLTARYAATHAHPAWRYCLTPMPVPALVRAVLADRRAGPEVLAAALTLVSEPGSSYDEEIDAAAALRERLRGFRA